MCYKTKNMKDKETIDKFLEEKNIKEHELVFWKHKVSNGFKLKQFMKDFLNFYREQNGEYI